MGEREEIVKINDWTLYKGTYWFTRLSKRGHNSYCKDGKWIQHECAASWYHTAIWVSWEPAAIDNKCPKCFAKIEEMDLLKLICFGKAIK